MTTCTFAPPLMTPGISFAVVSVGGASAGLPWLCCWLNAIAEIRRQNTANKIARTFIGIFPQTALVLASAFVYFCEIGEDEPPLAFSSAAFSAARAPARIFTASLLSSLQAYSNIGPFTALMGTMPAQGLLHVVRSSLMNLYSILF